MNVSIVDQQIHLYDVQELKTVSIFSFADSIRNREWIIIGVERRFVKVVFIIYESLLSWKREKAKSKGLIDSKLFHYPIDGSTLSWLMRQTPLVNCYIQRIHEH